MVEVLVVVDSSTTTVETVVGSLASSMVLEVSAELDVSVVSAEEVQAANATTSSATRGVRLIPSRLGDQCC